MELHGGVYNVITEFKGNMLKGFNLNVLDENTSPCLIILVDMKLHCVKKSK